MDVIKEIHMVDMDFIYFGGRSYKHWAFVEFLFFSSCLFVNFLVMNVDFILHRNVSCSSES